MALRVAENVPGDFFVDSSCIDCDACRQIAPAVFAEAAGQSAVLRQPESEAELLSAQKALIACPTASIGSVRRQDMRKAVDSFPERVAGSVFRCGYTAQSSFGAFSYLIRRPEGNVLVDSPRFAGPLVRRIEELGGVRLLLLTHRDDVADHERFRQRFGCRRVLHRQDVGPGTASVESQPEGFDPVELEPGLLMIPTPGHTRGHAVFLYDQRFLFTGDHLAWDPLDQRLIAFRGACWYSWADQIRSMERLLDYRFEWVLPGHGRPVQLPEGRMARELERCVAWMRQV